MARFTNGAGQEWEVKIDVYLHEQVLNRVSVDFDRMLDDSGKGMLDLFKSSVTVARVLWVLCEDRAKELNVTPEQFGRALAGDCFEDARLALFEAIADFSPPQVRKILRALGQKGEIVRKREVARVLEAIEKMPESLNSATDSPESAGPIPTG